MPIPFTRRKSLATVLQHEALKDEEQHLHTVFAMAEHRLPPPRDEAEKQERNQLLLLGITTAGLGALVYLRHHHPAIHRQVVGAALRYTEDRIMKRPARFQIRTLNKDDQFWGRARNLSLHAAHQFLLPRLRAALKIRSSAPLMPATRIARADSEEEAEWSYVDSNHGPCCM